MMRLSLQAAVCCLLAFTRFASSQDNTSTPPLSTTLLTSQKPDGPLSITSTNVSPPSSFTPGVPGATTDNAPRISTIAPSSSGGQTFIPTPSPSPTGDLDGGDDYSGGMVNYYFVFLALILCVAGLGGFLIMRRRRRAMLYANTGRQHALSTDIYGVHAFDPARARRRYWQGRWRSAEVSREEGLNEHGEAPPPYIPKPDEEHGGDGRHDGEPAVPLQTLSREDAGLKPPDYEQNVQEVGRNERNSSHSNGSSSRIS